MRRFALREHKLEPVLDFAQQAIGLEQHLVFLIAEAADSFERLEGLDGVALPDLDQVAAVEELEELDGELDVANAAVAGLDLAIAGTSDAVMMVEAGAKELPEEQMLEAVRFGHEALQDIIKMQEKLVQAVNIAKRPFQPSVVDADDDGGVDIRLPGVGRVGEEHGG